MRYADHDRDGWPLAMLGFSTAAWKLAPRDKFIGWTPQLREKNLPLVVDNPRFLILPWITIPNLGSHILAIIRRRLSDDWTERYNTSIGRTYSSSTARRNGYAIFHRFTAADADADLTAFAALNAARVLDVLSSTPARPDSRSPCVKACPMKTQWTGGRITANRSHGRAAGSPPSAENW